MRLRRVDNAAWQDFDGDAPTSNKFTLGFGELEGGDQRVVIISFPEPIEYVAWTPDEARAVAAALEDAALQAEGRKPS